MFPLLLAAALSHFEARLGYSKRGSIRELGRTFNYHVETGHADAAPEGATHIDAAAAEDAGRHILISVVDAFFGAGYAHTYYLDGLEGGVDFITVEFGAYNLFGD